MQGTVAYNVQYDSLDEYKEHLDRQMSDIEKFMQEQKELIEEGKEEDELMEYRYVRNASGEIVVMSKPFFKLTPKELKDSENCMTGEPFSENDPDVKIYKLKNPEKFTPFQVQTNLEDRKNNMDIKDKKPKELPVVEEVKKPKEPEKSLEQMYQLAINARMKEEGWNPKDVYKEFEPDLEDPKPRKIITKRKKAVWEKIDDILQTSKVRIEHEGFEEYVVEEKDETEEQVQERLRLEEKKKQRVLDQRIAKAVQRIKDKRETERLAKEAERQKVEEEKRRKKEEEEKEKYERLLKKRKEEEERFKKQQEEQEVLRKQLEIEEQSRQKQLKIERERQALKDLEQFIKDDAKDSILLYDRTTCLDNFLTVHSLPDKLVANKLTVKEEAFMRYQTIVLPVVDDFVVLSKLLPYFLLNSAIGLVQTEVSRGDYMHFVYSCVGCVMTALTPPFNRPLFGIEPEVYVKAKKVVILVFDTESTAKSELIANDLKRVPLLQIISKEDIAVLNECGKRYYEVADKDSFGEESTLHDLCIVMDSVVNKYETFKPIQPSWKILTRELTLKSFSKSPLPLSESEQENVCILFKDITVKKEANTIDNSLSWTLRKLMSKGLTIIGARIGHVGFSDISKFRERVVEQKEDHRYTYLALAVRGWEGFSKMCTAIGPTDPVQAKTTDPKSLRALFGNSREENCAVPLGSITKNAKSLSFWFAGRVDSKAPKSKSEAYKKMYGAYKDSLCTGTLHVSPRVERKRYSELIAACTKLGVSVLDARLAELKGKVAEGFEEVATKSYPGFKCSSTVGLALTIQKEGLRDCIGVLKKKIVKNCGLHCSADTVLHMSYTESGSIYEPACCALSDNFDSLLAELTPKDTELRYAVVVSPSNTLQSQLRFSKIMKILEQEKFELDPFETMGLIRVGNLPSFNKGVKEMMKKITTAIKSKDFFMWILRGRNLYKKFKESYDYNKRRFFMSGKVPVTVPGLVIVDRKSIEQLCDIYGHCSGRLFDDTLNKCSYAHDGENVYTIPSEQLMHSMNACEANKVVLGVTQSMKDSVGFCLIKPYMSPTQLFTRVVKSLSNSGLVLVDILMARLTPSQMQLFHSLEIPDSSPEDHKRYVEYLESGPCYAALFKGKDSLYKMRKVIGVNSCAEEERYAYLRFSSWKNDIENGLYFAEHHTTVLTLREVFFPLRAEEASVTLQVDAKGSSRALVKDINLSPLEEVALLIFSPTLVASGEYIYPLGQIMKEKCHIANIRKGRIQNEDLKLIFASKKHSVEVLVCLALCGRLRSLIRASRL